MSQFIQAGQLSQIPGSAGNVQVVENNQPLLGDLVGNLVQQGAKTFDAYGDVYARDKAQGLVEDTLSEVDAAVAAAEDGAGADEVPDSVKLDANEWTVLSNAVKNGEMTRTKAKLLASSRLRTRISEEPMFANKLRKAASGVIGFNIESIGAQSYFGAYPTTATEDPKNKYLSDIRQQAQGMAAILGGDPVYYEKELAKRDANKVRMENVKNQLEVNAINASEYANEGAQIDDQEAFGDVIADLGAMTSEGQPIDNVVVGNTLQARKEIYLSNLRQGYVDAEGDLNSEEWARIEKATDERYQGYTDLIEAFGVDNLKQVRLDRLDQGRKLLGAELYGDVLLAKDIYGEQSLGTWFELVSKTTNDTQRAQLFRTYPQLKAIDEIMRNGPEAIDKMMSRTTNKVLTGQSLDEDDMEVIDPAAESAYEGGTEEMQDSVIETLRDNSLTIKAASVIAGRTPSQTSVKNIKALKEEYEPIVSSAVSRLSGLVADSTGLAPYRRDDGTVGIKLSARAEGQTRLSRDEDMDKLERANELLDDIEVFYGAIDNSWGRQLGTTKEELTNRVIRDIEQQSGGIRNRREITEFRQQQDQFKNLVFGGNYEDAQASFETLREQRPEDFSLTFDELYSRMRAARVAEE